MVVFNDILDCTNAIVRSFCVLGGRVGDLAARVFIAHVVRNQQNRTLSDFQLAVLYDLERHMVSRIIIDKLVCGQTHRIGLVFIASTASVCAGGASSRPVDGNVIFRQAAAFRNNNFIIQVTLLLSVINPGSCQSPDLDRYFCAIADNAIHMPLTAGIFQYIPVHILFIRFIDFSLFCQLRHNSIIIRNNRSVIQIGNDIVLQISALCSGDLFSSISINNPFGNNDIIFGNILSYMLIIRRIAAVWLVRDYAIEFDTEEQLAFGYVPNSVKLTAVLPHGVDITGEEQSIMISGSVFILIEVLYGCPPNECCISLFALKLRKDDLVACLGLCDNLGRRIVRVFDCTVCVLHLRVISYGTAIVIENQLQIIVFFSGRCTQSQLKTRIIAACFVDMVLSFGLYVGCGSNCIGIINQICFLDILTAHVADVIIRCISQRKQFICSGKMPYKNRLGIS